MPNRCDVLGKRPSTGHSVSHSNIKSKRWWKVNAQKKRFWLPSEKRWVTLHISAKGLRTIDKRGIERVVADIRATGQKV
ncbi:MAG: 50S ribosomal protein L28 [Actinobacteria bacterium]|jgi:large subunit ribosomal protein L28|nr:MAG: 50S ribosomal protein L28 [Acidimicrobium sp. BACL17 MAG-120924-bin0]KRO43349.1 MAG: 50S ribosomal protein L28 [Acidimicrobium sp. BACL17 MAG-120823-bin42]MDA0193027.1 50S ribosomal protein L28 [Actinomycetota bacterium]MDA2951856.1 50S ribosomal protein L28 [Actinomycetota bacterium]MDA2999252.1 50S ribosomal protein L28 [Actinomycetota bacterium]